MSWLHRMAVAIPAILVAGYGCVETVRFARAEGLSRGDSVAALQAALRMTPGNADYHARIATLDARRDDELRVALALNPREPSWWIMRSVRQEQDGDVAGAEQSLREANVVSRYYAPRWALAAFYYRQGSKAEFLRWARSALSAGYGAPDSLFQMAQRLEIPSSTWLHDLVPEVPDRVDDYLRFLLRQGKAEQEYAAATQLIQIGSSRNRRTVLETCESLFAAGRTDEAVALWNKAIEMCWIARVRLDPTAGKSMGNDAFAGERLELGFDWKSSIPPGVSASRSDQSLCLEFSGRQPERCELIGQLVPLLPGKRYQMKVRYRLNPARSTGLHWSVLPVLGGKPIMEGLLTASTENTLEQTFPFETPPQSGPTRLALSYARQLGTTRMEGKLWLQSVQLTLVP